jgi:hypothetical protein
VLTVHPNTASTEGPQPALRPWRRESAAYVHWLESVERDAGRLAVPRRSRIFRTGLTSE